MRKNASGIVFGLLLAGAGVALLGRAIGWWDFRLLFAGWWTLFLVLPCLVSILEKGIKVGNTLGLLLGVALFLAAQNIVTWRQMYNLLLPVLLLAAGLALLLKPLFRKKIPIASAAGKGNDYLCLFSHQNIHPVNEVFNGAEGTAIFGSFVLDLRQAVIAQNVKVEAVAIFGGITIFAPPNVRVVTDSIPVLGGVSNKAVQSLQENAPVLYVDCVAVFGGVEIK